MDCKALQGLGRCATPQIAWPRFVEVHAGGAAPAGGGDNSGGGGNADTVLGDETTAECQVLMGRWRSESLSTLADEAWWSEMQVSHIVRGPLTHLMRWLQQAAAGEHGGTPVANLVCKKVPLLKDELGQLFGDPAAFGAVNEALDGSWRPRAFMQLLEMAADLQRRVVAPCADLPLSLAWLVWQPAGTACRARMHIASQILACGDALRPSTRSPKGIDGASSKLARLFRTELRQAAVEGVICPKLFGFLRSTCGAQSAALQTGLCSPRYVRAMDEAIGRVAVGFASTAGLERASF